VVRKSSCPFGQQRLSPGGGSDVGGRGLCQREKGLGLAVLFPGGGQSGTGWRSGRGDALQEKQLTVIWGEMLEADFQVGGGKKAKFSKVEGANVAKKMSTTRGVEKKGGPWLAGQPDSERRTPGKGILWYFPEMERFPSAGRGKEKRLC